MIARRASWRSLAVISCFCCLKIGAATEALAQDAARAQGAYFLGTATTGGTYHPVGVALSTLIKLKLLPSFDADLTAVNTEGSRENVELLRRNDIQFAIVSALAGYDARTGTGQFAAAGPNDNLRAITTLWLSTDHLLVRAEAVQSGTIDDFLSLKGRPVSLGRQDSGTLLGNRTLMEALGVDIDIDFNLVELGYGDSAQALAAGTIDGMSVSGGVPIGAVQEAFAALGDQAMVLEVNDEQLTLIDRGRGLWQRVTIPSGTYQGQSRDIFTIGTPNILAVRADVDDEVVYQITKTIFEELDYLHGLHGATRQISLDNAVNNLPLPIHAGAVRYFEENGVELPPPPFQMSDDLLARYGSAADARADANQSVVTLFAGTEGDTTTRVASELSTVLDAAEDGVRLLTTAGGGLGRNLTDLLYLKGVDAALVRADVLNYAQERKVYPALQNQVNYISEMFPEEVHLLVGDDISDLSDLIGKKINLGAPGSGSDITASIILSKLGISAEPTGFEPLTAIDKLKRGEIAGAFFVGGKPMPLLRQIEAGTGLKILPLPLIDYLDSYRATEIADQDYPNLVRGDDAVPTIAVRTALLTYAWRPDSARNEPLSTLSSALFEHLLELHADGYHPKWREVDPTAEFDGWSRFEPASLWIDDNEGTARRIVGEGRQLQERQQRGEVQFEAGRGGPTASDTDPSSTDVAPEKKRAADAAVLPEAPAVEPVPANGQPPSRGLATDLQRVNGALPNGVSRGGAAAAFPAPSVSDDGANANSLPATGVNKPTF